MNRRLGALALALLLPALLMMLAPPVRTQPIPPAPAILKGNPPGGVGAACSSTPRIGYLDSSGRVITCPSGTHIWTVLTGGGGGSTTVTQNTDYTFDGGGTALSGSARTCKFFPVAATLTAVPITSEAADGTALAGTATINLLSESLTAFIAGTAPSNIKGSGAALQLTAARGVSGVITGYTTAISASTMLCVDLTSPADSVRLHVGIVHTITTVP